MSAMEAVRLGSIGQIANNAKDLGRAVSFYRDTLGVRLLLGVASEPALDHPASIIYYRVPDIHPAHEAVQRRGVAFITAPHLVARMPDHELWLADFRDSEDNILALMSRRWQCPVLSV